MQLRFLVRVPKMLFIFAFLSLLCIEVSEKSLSAATQQPHPPVSVEIGVWLTSIHSLDLLDGSFGVEFYLWFISPNADFRPFDVFQILNGRHWAVRSVNRRKLPNGTYYTAGFVSATINNSWDLLYYPFDRQHIKIIIETPLTASEMRFVPNHKDSGVSEFVDVAGFKLSAFGLREIVHEYKSDFGYGEAVGRQFSRLFIEVELKRESERLVVVMLIGFIVANLITLFTYAVPVNMLGIRTGVLTAAIFSAIGNMYLISSKVHMAVGSLVIDRCALGTFSTIVITLLSSIIVDRLVRWGKLKPGQWVNWTVFFLVLFGSGILYINLYAKVMR